MKKDLMILGVATIAVFSLVFCGSVFAAELSGKIGLGYQGMISGDEYFNGVSARGWITQEVGLEGNFFYGGIDADYDCGDYYGDFVSSGDLDLYAFEAKLMFAPVVKANSRFYLGVNVGYGYLDYDIDDEDIWMCGAFIGSEWNFQEIPELGFNFDVGYKYATYDDDCLDVDIDGIAATFGIHYYF